MTIATSATSSPTLWKQKGTWSSRPPTGKRRSTGFAAGARGPCIILLDLMMPRMDGVQFRTELLNDNAFAHIPVVVLSADPSAIVAAKSLNFAGSLRKPVPLEALLAAVHAHCA